MGQKFHKFRAPSLDAAYRAMRTRLGKDAVVVRTTQIKEGGFGGFLGRKMVELTASALKVEAELCNRKKTAVEKKYVANSVDSKKETSETVEYFQKLVSDAQKRIANSNAATATTSTNKSNAVIAPVIPFQPKQEARNDTDDIRKELHELRDMVRVLVAETPGADLPPEFAPQYRKLLKKGVSRTTAASIVADVIKDSDLKLLQDPLVFRERLNIELRKKVQTTGGIGLTAGTCKIVALVGATGVGKTTNLAKLAARYAVRERARVGLITTDTYRIAAPDHLRVYANIIGVSMKVVNDTKDMNDALRTFKDFDLVLMDTAGGSQFNYKQTDELMRLLQIAKPDEVFLVLSANTHHEELNSMVENFSCLQPTSLFFTKLDETKRYGALLSIMAESELPLSYISIGQNVPDDLALAHPGMISNMILEGGDRRGRSSTKIA